MRKRTYIWLGVIAIALGGGVLGVVFDPGTANPSRSRRLRLQFGTSPQRRSFRVMAAASSRSRPQTRRHRQIDTDPPEPTIAQTNDETFRVNDSERLVLDEQTRLNMEALFARTEHDRLAEAKQQAIEPLPAAAECASSGAARAVRQLSAGAATGVPARRRTGDRRSGAGRVGWLACAARGALRPARRARAVRRGRSRIAAAGRVDALGEGPEPDDGRKSSARPAAARFAATRAALSALAGAQTRLHFAANETVAAVPKPAQVARAVRRRATADLGGHRLLHGRDRPRLHSRRSARAQPANAGRQHRRLPYPSRSSRAAIRKSRSSRCTRCPC